MGDQESFCLRQMLQEKHLRAASSKWRIQENARGEGYYGVCEMGFQAVRHRKLHPCNWMDEGRRSLRYVDGVAGLYRPGQAVGHPTTTLCRDLHWWKDRLLFQCPLPTGQGYFHQRKGFFPIRNRTGFLDRQNRLLLPRTRFRGRYGLGLDRYQMLVGENRGPAPQALGYSSPNLASMQLQKRLRHLRQGLRQVDPCNHQSQM